MSSQSIRYIRVFLFPILLMLVPASSLNILFLRGAGELEDASVIARMQQETGGLYGTAVHQNVYGHKLSLLAERRPDIVIVGSSRVLAFRQRHFGKPFVNLGLTVRSPAEVLHLAKDMLSIWRPELVILGVDFWWGNDEVRPPSTFHDKNNIGGNLSPQAVTAPIRWMLDKKISHNLYFDLATSSSPVQSGGLDMYGIQAITIGEGFGPDGSYYYSDIVFGRQTSNNIAFHDTLRSIATGTNRFRYGQTAASGRVQEVQEAIDFFRKNGVNVITFMPPAASRVYREIEKKLSSYGYLEPFRYAISGISELHADFLNGDTIPSGECEFIDGFHGGDLTSARILSRLAELPGSPLADYLTKEQLDDDILRYTGNAQVDHKYRLSGEREIDFLGIGCKKITEETE